MILVWFAGGWMKRFGKGRIVAEHAVSRMPGKLCVEDNPVRVIDAFVDADRT
jgi:hypothetical protein